MRSKFKYAIMFAIIAFSISIASGIYGGFRLIEKDVFEYIYNLIMEGYFEILPEEEIYLQMYDTMQVSLVVMSFVGALLCIPAVVFSIICINHYSLSVEAFERKRKIHILTLIFIGVGYFASNNTMGAAVNSIFAFLSTPCDILAIASFFMFLYEYRLNRKQVVLSGRYDNDYPTKNNNDNSVLDAEVTLSDKDKEPEISQEEKERRQQKLDELYMLLAKLEKSYKNNELSTEEYQRMKETILSNFNNKS